MTSSAEFPNIGPGHSGQPSDLRRQAAEFFIARRVRITALAAVAIVIRTLTSGESPHSLWGDHDLKSMLGAALVVSGLAVRSWAAGILQKNKSLATTGPYALMRNPLYLGSVLVLAGFAVLFNDESETVLLAVPLAALYVLQVLHEEQKLQDGFGAGWVLYAASVPRFIPRSLSTDGLSTWRMQNWLSNREYRAAAAVLLGLLAMEFWDVH